MSVSWHIGVPILALTFVAMEAIAWSLHRYVMHGALWVLHQDHHVPRSTGVGRFGLQLNDSFALFFAIPSWLCIMFGLQAGGDARAWVGFGILAYGVAYTLVHETLIHRRMFRFLRTDHWYVRALRRAHGVHHQRRTREGCESFGMLAVAPRYLREALAAKQRRAKEATE